MLVTPLHVTVTLASVAPAACDSLAASILAMTLLDICEDAEVKREDGHISIKHGDPAAILFARRGYKLLADAYPEFVEVI